MTTTMEMNEHAGSQVTVQCIECLGSVRVAVRARQRERVDGRVRSSARSSRMQIGKILERIWICPVAVARGSGSDNTWRGNMDLRPI